MENIYQTCQRCQQGKIARYPLKNRWINVSLMIFFVIAGYFFFTTAASVVADKLVDKEIPLTDPRWKQLLLTAILSAIVAIPAHYFYNILAHLRSWITKDCPYCEQGYIIAQRASNIQAIIYFFDLFLFQQILLPMFKTLTFQFLYKKRSQTHPIMLFAKFILYLSLFFGAIPFMVFLLGRDHLLGLIIAVFIMVYILALIFLGNEENRTYQKGTIFLVIPLYYVSMVEIFRWSWFLSAKDMSLIPDQSSFLWMGIENLIRTQLFMDLFEVYDLGITTMSATTFLTHSAIFATRLVIDVALIAMLIQMAVDSFQRARHYKFTGEKVENITEGETLTDLENLVRTGSPKNIHDVKENLEKVLDIVHQVKPYATSVQQVAHDEIDRKAAEECTVQIEKLPTPQKEEKQPYSIHFLQRILAIAFVCAWASSFSLGINSFIRNVISHEISLLMAAAEREQFKHDPIARQNFYLKALSKDETYHPARWKSVQTYLQMTDANLNLLDTDEALNNIEKYFEQIEHLRRSPQYEELYQQQVTELQPKAYRLRGLAFLLQNRIDLAIAELRRRQTLENRRLIFNVMLVQTSHNLFEQNSRELLENAYVALGFDQENPSALYAELLQSIIDGNGNKWYEVLYQLKYIFKNRKIDNPQLRQKFSLYLAQAAMRQGSDHYATSEKYFGEVLSAQPQNLEAVLGLANLYRLQKKYKQMDDLLLSLPQSARNSSYEGYLLATYILLGKKQSALELLDHIDRYPVRKHLKGYVTKYLAQNLPSQSLEDATFSWDISLSKQQQTIAYFYLALQNIRQKSFGKAVNYLRRVISLGQTQLLEYHQSKIEFENLQILLEGKSYQADLFFDRQYFSQLNTLIYRELQNIISPEKKAIEGLKLIMQSPYQANKKRAIRALTVQQIVSPKNFIPFLTQAIQESDNELKKIALEGMVAIQKVSVVAKEHVEKELQNPREDIRLLCIKVFAQWGKEGIEPLAKSLQNDNTYVRRDAAYALAQLGTAAKNVTQELQNLLKDNESMVRFAAFMALRQIGAPHNEQALTTTALEHQDGDLRLAALSEIEKYYNSLFVKHKQDLVPFLSKTLLHDKDGQNRKWAALRLIIYKDSQILNDAKLSSSLEEKTKLALSSNNLDEKLQMAIWLVNTYELWQQDKTPAINTVLQRWKIGSSKDQRRVIGSILSQIVSIDKNLLLLRAAFQQQNSHVLDAAQLMIEEMVREQNFSQIALPLITFCSKVIQQKNQSKRQRAISCIQFALRKKPKIAMPVCLQFLQNSREIVRNSFAKAITSIQKPYLWKTADIKSIFRGLNKNISQKATCKVAHHFRLQHPRLFTTYAKLLQHRDAEIVRSCIDLIILYKNKPQIDKIFSQLATAVENKPQISEHLFPQWASISTVEDCYQIAQSYSYATHKFPQIVLELQQKRNLPQNQITKFLFMWMKGKNKQAAINATAMLPKLKVWPVEAMSNLLDLAQANDEEISSEAQRVLLEMTSMYNVEDIRISLQDPSPKIRSAAVKAVGKMGLRAKTLFPVVRKLINDDSKQVQEAVIIVFAQLGKMVLPLIEDALQSDVAREKRNAIASLHNMAPKKAEIAIKTIAKHIGSKEDNFTLLFLQALEKHTTIRFQPLVLPTLQKMTLRSEETRIIYWNLMHVIGEKQIALINLTELLEVSQDNSLKILQRLINISPQYVTTYLKRAMRERYHRIGAKQAMHTLTQMKSVTGVKIILEEMAKDSNPLVRRKAEEVIDILLNKSPQDN
ncbi:HEAT repeat domain-containing protein [Candidatus Uabimicrobium amorphum]|uniref:HEAT repeat domain-containing protein n=1 Tax=Uabimicrobium amorphum TaxID=2596890 RepID=A0A5S9F344_UABAM|nr:HEAT repeat domain-containing protein [Candidatus Uabimicrobium amorphum]BBM83763.1 hypothetical protein UABAM_02118 [Candidatus Uabimicrobium amorphum]